MSAKIRRLKPTALNAATHLSLCLRQPINMAKPVVGSTSSNIQRWKSSCTKKLVATIGSSTNKTGVNKQCTAQTVAIPIAR